MLNIDIPGSSLLSLQHLVLDYNGTLAEDGGLLSGVDDRLRVIHSLLQVHIITADTHGTVRQKLTDLQVHLKILGQGQQDEQKAQFVRELGPQAVVAMGNGRNDVKMLAVAGLGVGILQREGCAAAVLTAARIVCTDIRDGLDLLLYPDRLRATLRN